MKLWLTKAFVGEYEVVEIREYQRRADNLHARTYVYVTVYNHMTGKTHRTLTTEGQLWATPDDGALAPMQPYKYGDNLLGEDD
jgi:hypothetical protein